MYTTPRKVKQESRLRRSLSLTNSARMNGHDPSTDLNNGGEDEEFEGLYNPYSSVNGINQEFPGTSQLLPQPPPYRDPPTLIQIDPIEDSNYQTHSSKFPVVVKEVKGPSSGVRNPSNPLHHSALLPDTHKLQNKKLTPKLAWRDERRAFTLDSETAREVQAHLLSQESFARRNSLDLERILQVFNEEQSLMASLQPRHLEGVDNPALDLGPIPLHQMYTQGGKMFYPGDSSSNSHSLSSSTADSIDTVIYKGSAQGSPSIREWQRSVDLNSERPLDFNHRMENNSFRDSSLFDSRSYQIQQPSPYQQVQFGSSGYPHDFRHSGQQSGGALSPPSIPSNCINNGNLNNGSSGNNNGGAGNLRTSGGTSGGNGMPMNYTTQPNGNLPSKSPLLPHKHLTPVADTEKKEPSKFHSKTYNHIKDMISSRFGNSSTSQPNNAPQNNKISTSNNSGQSALNSNQTSGQNSGLGLNSALSSGLNSGLNSALNSGINGGLNGGLNPSQVETHQTARNLNNGSGSLSANNPSVSYSDMSVYGSHQHSHQLHHVNYNGNGPYYLSQQSPPYQGGNPGNLAQSSNPPNGSGNPTNGNQHMANGHLMPNGAYKSPNLSDKKNINTSFRKAIAKATQKSNLSEDTVRNVNEPHQVHNHQHQHPIQQQVGGLNGNEAYRGAYEMTAGERAQRALDKLCENSPNFTTSRPLGNQSGYGRIPQVHQHSSQHGTQHGTQQPPSNFPPSDKHHENPHARHRFNAKPSSSSSKTPDMSIPAYVKNSRKLDHEGDQFESLPPPLPISQKPSIQENLQLGLPILPEKRENGDGSSGSMEGTNTKIIEGPLGLGKSKSDQLKAITTELQNLALSVEAQNLSSSSEGEKGPLRVGSGQSNTTTDSGHGTVLLAKSPQNSDPSSDPLESLSQRSKFGDHLAGSVSSGNDSEWVDIVEPEIRQILELERAAKMGKSGLRGGGGGNSSQQQSSASNQIVVSSTKQMQSVQSEITVSPIITHQQAHLPPTQTSHKSPVQSPKIPSTSKSSKKTIQEVQPGPSSGGQGAGVSSKSGKGRSNGPPGALPLLRSNSGSGQRSGQWSSRPRTSEKPKSSSRKDLSQLKPGKLTRNAMSQILYSLQDDNGDMTSTTTGLDLESILDGQTEMTSDDDDLSTTIDTTDAHAIRRQLESLESMYTEVLKVLGAKKLVGNLQGNRYSTSDLRNAKRRPYGSMSSLPSSVSSRPFKDKRKIDDKKKVKDIKSINRRFQRLESHVVTLARSVAHLSSEMRTQHLMVQEMESIRSEMNQLRNQVMKTSLQGHVSGTAQNPRGSTGRHGAYPNNSSDWANFRNALPSLTNPCRVRKLTKFFGDEPPLIRIFLKKLGYEKYATAFEQERIGIMELPYLTEERLNKMGIPMGPRLRILQEAQMCLKPGFHGHHESHHSHHNNHNSGNLSVYVV